MENQRLFEMVAGLKRRRAQLLVQIEAREHDGLPFHDLNSALRETQVALFRTDPSQPLMSRRID
jgi:hypothetical protein